MGRYYNVKRLKWRKNGENRFTYPNHPYLALSGCVQKINEQLILWNFLSFFLFVFLSPMGKVILLALVSQELHKSWIFHGHLDREWIAFASDTLETTIDSSIDSSSFSITHTLKHIANIRMVTNAYGAHNQTFRRKNWNIGIWYQQRARKYSRLITFHYDGIQPTLKCHVCVGYTVFFLFHSHGIE